MKKLPVFTKVRVLLISFLLFHVIIFTVNAQGPSTLYEMVPHVVLPQTVQYKPMPTSLSQPGTYTAYTNYPATYTAFPSYVLPYPTEMQPVQQAVYPVTPPTVPPVEQQPVSTVLPQEAQGTIVILVIPDTQKEEIKAQTGPKPLESRPLPALPRTIQKKIPYREFDVYADEEKEEQSSDVLQMDFSSSIESFLSRKKRPIPSYFTSQFEEEDYSLVQWSNPVNPYPVPTQNTMPNAMPYGFAMNSGYPPYANPYPQANTPGGASAPGLSQDVLNQIEQLLQRNPNMQFSAVMMGPNGQLIPLGGGNLGQQQAGQQPSQQQQVADPAQQMQQLQTQMQYIQAMNQYVHQLNAARMTPHGAPHAGGYYPGYGQFGGYAPYVQPIPGNNGAYALANPYYLAMYQSLYGGGYGQQPMYGHGGYGGHGPMFNPYLPTPQGYYGTMPDQKEKGFMERMRERRRKGEQQMSDAWRAPHYPEETGMRMPSKNAYPWGHFGAQVAPQETPNYGGYYGMYYGSSRYPGL